MAKNIGTKTEDPLEDPLNRKIWDLHIRAGASKADTARQLGIGRNTVYDRLKIIYDAVPAIDVMQVATMKQHHLERLDDLEGKLVRALNQVIAAPLVEQIGQDEDTGEPLIVQSRPDTLGIQRTTNNILKVLRERSNVVGLDAPKRIEIEGLSVDPLKEAADQAVSDIESFLANNASEPEDA